MTESTRVRARVDITGHVQGVYYRATTRETAREYGVDGWVRNCEDGSVEAVFEGPGSAVDALIEWCQTGSPAADVDDVERHEETPVGLDGFEVRW